MATLNFSTESVSFMTTLRPYALKLTSNRQDAQDLLQDTLMKAFASRDKFKEGTNLKGWLYTIMRNTFITNYKKKVRRKTFIDTTDEMAHINTGRTATNDGNSTLAVTEVMREVNLLSYAYKTPLKMYANGYHYKEIADFLDIPIGTVKNRIHVARKKLTYTLSPNLHETLGRKLHTAMV